MRRNLFAVVGALLLGVLGSGVNAAPTVVIGAEDDWLPYSGVLRGTLQGMTPEIVRAAFAHTGQAVQFEALPYARCLARVRSGELAACFNTLRNTRLEPDFLWHSPPLFRVQSRIYARADTQETALRPADLEGRRVAVTHSYEYGPEFDDNPRIQRVVSLRDENSFQMLVRGRVDYAMALDVNTALLLRRHPELAQRVKPVGAVAEAEVYAVFSRRHPAAQALLERFEKGLRQLARSGELKAIEARWMAWAQSGGTLPTP